MGLRIKKRAAAIERGDLTYYTGVPCKNGHVDERYTGSGGCRQCIKLSATRDRAYIKQRRHQRLNGGG